MLVSSASVSAVAEAQNVLRELRDRANRAMQEAARQEREAETLEARATKLIVEVQAASAECVVLNDECARQESFLVQLPERIAKATTSAESILKTWSDLDADITCLFETHNMIAATKKHRASEFEADRASIESKLQLIESNFAPEVIKMQNEIDELNRSRIAFDFGITEAETSLTSVSHDMEAYSEILKELKAKEDDTLKALEEAIQREVKLANDNVTSDELVHIRAQMDHDQENTKLEEAARSKQKTTFLAELESYSVNLATLTNEMAELQAEIVSKDAVLAERNQAKQAARERLENLLFGLGREREILMAQRETDRQALDAKAAELNGQWNDRIQQEVATIESEIIKIKQQVEDQLLKSKIDEEEWEARVNARREELEKASVEKASIQAEQPRTSEKASAAPDHDEVKQASGKKKKKVKTHPPVAAKEDPKQSVASSSSKVVLTPPALSPGSATTALAESTVSRSKSIAARILETATGLIIGKSSKPSEPALSKQDIISKMSPVPFQLTELEKTSPPEAVSHAVKQSRSQVKKTPIKPSRSSKPTPAVSSSSESPLPDEFQLTPKLGASERKKNMAARIKTPDWVNNRRDDEIRAGQAAAFSRQPPSHKSLNNERKLASSGAATSSKQADSAFVTPVPTTATYSRKNSMQPVMTYSRTKTTSASQTLVGEDLPRVTVKQYPAVGKGTKVVYVKKHQKDRHKSRKTKKSNEDEDHSSASQFDLFE